MSVLSEYSILQELVFGEAVLLRSGQIPESLAECQSFVEKTEKDPSPEDLVQLKKMVKQYFNSLRSTSSNARIEKIGHLAASGELSKSLVFDDFDPDSLRGMTYDLRIGREAFLNSHKLPFRLDDQTKPDMVVIEPGDFAILITYEYVHVPSHLMGFISVRMKYKSQGLVNISGFHVDPSFYGRI